MVSGGTRIFEESSKMLRGIERCGSISHPGDVSALWLAPLSLPSDIGVALRMAPAALLLMLHPLALSLVLSMLVMLAQCC